MENQAMSSPAPRPRVRPQQVAFHEHAAPDGTNTIGVLKLLGVLAIIGGTAMAFFVIAGANSKDTPKEFSALATYFAVMFFFQGLVAGTVLLAMGLISENLVAVRKNTAHLAGIRANTAKELQRPNHE